MAKLTKLLMGSRYETSTHSMDPSVRVQKPLVSASVRQMDPAGELSGESYCGGTPPKFVVSSVLHLDVAHMEIIYEEGATSMDGNQSQKSDK